MSGWLSKASNVFQRDASEGPQPFESQCECGQTHSGVRRSRHQHIVCKSCGASLFILPRDVYPPPHQQEEREKTAPVAPSDDPLTSPAEPDFSEEVEHKGERTRRKAHRDPPRRSTRRERKRKAKLEQVPLDPDRPGWLRSVFARGGKRAVSLQRGFLAFWSPFRLVVLAVLLIGLFTTGWSIYQRSLARATVAAKENWNLGLEAVEREDWIAARNEFRKAAQAVDLLKRHDPESEQIRQYYRETRTLTRMASVSLFELLEEAAGILEQKDAEEWERIFKARHRGDWMVLEGPVRKVTSTNSEGKETTGFELSFPWSPRPEQTVTVRADFPVFETLIPGTEPASVIFGGELEECRLSGARSGWIIRFRPSTGFLWAHEETLQNLGLGPAPSQTFDEFREQLQVQARAMGVAP